MSTAGALERTILIADVVGSAALYEALGDVEAQLRVGALLEQLCATVERLGGRVVKLLGDGALCTFRAGRGALQAALELHGLAAASGLELRVGLHRGALLEEDGDVFGDAVNCAARIAGVAKAGEILLSTALRGALPAPLERVARGVPPLRLRGGCGPLELLAIQVEDLGSADDAQTKFLAGDAPAAAGRPQGLRLVHLGREHVLLPGEEATIGRDEARTIRIERPHVSRLHARLYCRRDKFCLHDTSVNGTWLVLDGQPKQHLVRERAILHGSGTIHPGADPDAPAADPADAIRYGWLEPLTRPGGAPGSRRRSR